LRLVGCCQWDEQPVVDLGIEDGDADAVVGQHTQVLVGGGEVVDRLLGVGAVFSAAKNR
jgi:hypothetical protein